MENNLTIALLVMTGILLLFAAMEYRDRKEFQKFLETKKNPCSCAGDTPIGQPQAHTPQYAV